LTKARIKENTVLSRFPAKCVIDTNVPIVANLALDPESIPHELSNCVLKCIEVMEYITQSGCLVIDDGDEIFHEYRSQLSLSGQPGMGDAFLKWVHDHRWVNPKIDQVIINKTGRTYREFPDDKRLAGFDASDKKFVAAANAHTSKPPIIEATDSKWWAFRKILAENGVNVLFICEDYVRTKFTRKS
jgi:hypothetical protein